MIPYLCPSFLEKQREALSYLVTGPTLVYTQRRDSELDIIPETGRVRQIVAPGSFHNFVAL